MYSSTPNSVTPLVCVGLPLTIEKFLHPYKRQVKYNLRWQILSTLTHSPFLCKEVLYLYFVINVLEETAPTVVCDSCVRATAG
jgi:hypothetical protein